MMVTRCKKPKTTKISEKIYGNACGNVFKLW